MAEPDIDMVTKGGEIITDKSKLRGAMFGIFERICDFTSTIGAFGGGTSVIETFKFIGVTGDFREEAGIGVTVNFAGRS